MKAKSIWKTKGFKSWFFTSIPLTAIALTVGIVLTQNSMIYGTMNQVFSGERRKVKSGDPSKYQYYTTEYESKEDVLEAANKLNEEIAEEGMILLKNEGDSLPLAESSKVTVFGKNSVNMVYGGSGSNASSSNSQYVKDIYQSLEAAGFSCNPTMRSFYEDDGRSGSGRPASPDMNSTITGLTGFPTGETPLSSYSADVKASFGEYDDAAIVMISRIGGEGFDLPKTMFYDGKNYQNWEGSQLIPGAKSKDSHYLELDQNETDMLALACQSFDNVVLVINSANPMELGFLEDENDPSYDEHIKAAIWMSDPGDSGAMALGRILKGDVNPSGRTVDTFPRNFEDDPTWNNFSNNRSEGGNQYEDSTGKKRSAYFVNYSESIYVGYRYWETRGFTDGEGWYDDKVVYPFGYGLSYTGFEWNVMETNPASDSTFDGDDTIEIKVKVKNTGNKAGKDVVELYYSAPYEAGKIEKSHTVLGDFAKTSLLNPGDEEVLTLSVKARDMASYDYDDSNGNGFEGYELDKGTYTFYVGENSHDYSRSINLNLDQSVRYENDDASNTKIENLFDDVSDRITTYLSRSDWNKTWPTLPTKEMMTLSDSDLKKLAAYKVDDSDDDPYYAYEAPTQQDSALSYEDTKVKLWSLIGKDYDDPLWDELLDQLTVGQMANLVVMGNYHTEAIGNIDKPITTDPDGPMGYSIFMGNTAVYDTCHYATESLAGATYNQDLLERFGEMVGDESLIGNKKGDGATYCGWYAPAANIHRSQFAGRNFEYYSEDPLLSAKMATSVIKGAKSKGVYTYMKHFALNDQETNRDSNGILTWANEQSMREIYFKPFEMAVKIGKTTALMSSFNRIGFTWAGGNYNLLTKLLRDEWGFKGMVVTDYNLQTYMNLDQMIRAGGDINLSQTKSLSDTSSATAVASLRRATKNILYTVANSNGMNGFGEGVRYYYAKPMWYILTWVCVSSLLAILVAWGVFICIRIPKTERVARETGTYRDGSPYFVPRKPRTYRLSTGSIVYVSLVGVALLSTIGLSIGFMAIPDKVTKDTQQIQGYISSISLSLNNKSIDDGEVEIDLSSLDNYLQVSIDSYGMDSGGYSLTSSNEDVLTIGDDNKLNPQRVGESIVTATVNANTSIKTSVLVKVKDSSVKPEKQTHSITVIDGEASVYEAQEGDIITLTPVKMVDGSFIKWNFDVDDIWTNGNTFRMPDSDIVVTAFYKYKEFTLTLANATFEDGSSSRIVEYKNHLDDLVAGTPTEVYQSTTQIGWIDEEGDLYDLDFVMPNKDLTISPFFDVDGPKHTLSTDTRNYAGGTVIASKTKFGDITSTSYVIPAGVTGDYFDIMNASSSTDGFYINKDENRNLIYMFKNEGDYDISFKYYVECGTADIVVPKHSYVMQRVQAVGTKSVRPYHHLTLNADLEGETTLVISEFEYDKYSIRLNNATFEDGSTSITLRAGDAVPTVTYDAGGDTKEYEKWDLLDQDGNTFAYTTMPYKDLEVTARKTVKGTNNYLGGARYNVSRNDITSEQVVRDGQKAVTYTIPTCTSGTKFDIMNKSTSEGYMLNAGETKNILFRFFNDEDASISFTYDTEFGSQDVVVEANSTLDVIIEVTNSTSKNTRAYHHFTMKEDLAQDRNLTIACFELDATE